MSQAAEVSTTGTSDFARKRREIIECAAEVFAERGFVAGTTKEIANRVGLSQPAIYHYVGSKEDLLTEIAMQVDRDMKAALEHGLAQGSTARDRLRGVISAFTAAVVENRLTFTVYYKELHSLQDSTRTKIAKDEREFVAGVAALVSELQDEGLFAKDMSTLVLTEALIGMVSWLHRWYRPSGPLDADEIAEHFISLVGV